MFRTTLAGVMVFLLACGAAAAPTGEKLGDLKKSIDLGDLDVYFKLASAEKVFDPQRGGKLILTLEAKTDVDTAQFFYKAGFFDKDSKLHLASPARFDAAFPLKKGESIRVEIWEGRAPQHWHRISLRKVDKPVPRSEYHYQ